MYVYVFVSMEYGLLSPYAGPSSDMFVTGLIFTTLHKQSPAGVFSPILFLVATIYRHNNYIRIYVCTYTMYMYLLCMYVFAARKDELGIAGFGISVTTMEEVFIKVGEGTDETLQER